MFTNIRKKQLSIADQLVDMLVVNFVFIKTTE